MQLISGIYCKPTKSTVNCRRVNRELRRHKLALASFVSVPRLIKAKYFNRPRLTEITTQVSQ